MPSVEGKENVDGQTLPILQSTAGGGTIAEPANKPAGGVGPRSGSRKPSQRIAALECSSAGPNLRAGIVRAPPAFCSSAAAAAARCPAADSIQQSLVPTPATKSRKKPARRSGGAINASPSLETTDESPSALSVASVGPRDPKRSGGSSTDTAAAATAGLDKKRKSRGRRPVLSSPVSLPCATSSKNSRKKTSKKIDLTTDGARGQEGKAPQRGGIEGVNRRGKGKGRGGIKTPATVTSKPSSPPRQGRSHFDFDLDDGGSDVSTRALYPSEEAASAAGEGPQATAHGNNKRKLSLVHDRGVSPPPPHSAVAVTTTSQVRPTVTRQAPSPDQSAGTQSPRGSWHLGTLFGESEDEEEEAHETGLWRLSDDDRDEPDLGEGGVPGRGTGKRCRMSGRSAGDRGGGDRGGGRGLSVGSVDSGGKASRGKRVSDGGMPRKKPPAAAAAAAAAGTGGGGGGGGGSGKGGGASLGDKRGSVTAEESDIPCATPLLTSPDKATAKKRGAHPKRLSKGEKQEQQEELEAKKELHTLLAQFKRVDSHRLNLSR
eukprot:jgi/Undpi1/6351/HiC_scaffold_20.g08832.m1